MHERINTNLYYYKTATLQTKFLRYFSKKNWQTRQNLGCVKSRKGSEKPIVLVSNDLKRHIHITRDVLIPKICIIHIFCPSVLWMKWMSSKQPCHYSVPISVLFKYLFDAFPRIMQGFPYLCLNLFPGIMYGSY